MIDKPKIKINGTIITMKCEKCGEYNYISDVGCTTCDVEVVEHTP